MKTNHDETLKDCPFCDGEAVMQFSDPIDDEGIGEATALCTSCGASIGGESFGSARGQIAAAWNRRSTPSQQEPTRAVSPNPLEDAALERLEQYRKQLKLSEYYSNSPPMGPPNEKDLSHILTRFREMREALEKMKPRPIEETPESGRFLAYWFQGWEQVSRYDGSRYVHVESMADHSNEESIEQFTAWLPLDALPRPDAGETP